MFCFWLTQKSVGSRKLYNRVWLSAVGPQPGKVCLLSCLTPFALCIEEEECSFLHFISLAYFVGSVFNLKFN